MASCLEETCAIVVVVAYVVAELEKPKRKKRKWVKQWLTKRNELSHNALMKELSLEPGDWFNYLCMDEATYLKLLSHSPSLGHILMVREEFVF